MDQLTAMKVFKRVVELEGFSAAARDLGLSTAGVSKNVAELEAHLGVRLLVRTTRRVSVTEAGETYYRRCARILEELAEADHEAAHLTSTPRGTLRVAAPMSFGQAHLAPRIPELLERYPELELDLVLNDRYADLVDESFDVALRAGSGLGDSTHVAKKLAPIRRVVCATPEYFEANGVPQSPEDLTGHRCLIYSLSSAPRRWTFEGPDGPKTVEVSGRCQINNSLALAPALLAGGGLALVPTFVVGDALREGKLVAVLGEWQPQPQWLYAIYLSRRYVPAKIRSFIDFAVEKFGPEPDWDRDLP